MLLLSNALRLVITFLSRFTYPDACELLAAVKIYPFPYDRQTEKVFPIEIGLPNFYNNSISDIIYRKRQFCF